MIKKILSSLLVSSVLFFASATTSIAMERPTIAIGGAINYGGYVASGQETEGGSTAKNLDISEEETRAMEVGYTSVFFELGFGDRVTVGMEYMAETVETEVSSRTDAEVTSEVQIAAEKAGSGNNNGTSTVKAAFSDMVTAYLEVRLINGFYAKYGAMEIDIETKEQLHTDSEYPNKTLSGNAYGFGVKNSWDNGIFMKAETMVHDWDKIKISALGTATGNSNNTFVEGTLDGIVASFRVGKAF